MLLSVITVGLSSVCGWGIGMNSGGSCNLFTDKTTLAIGNIQTKGRLYTPIRADKSLPLLIRLHEAVGAGPVPQVMQGPTNGVQMESR